MAENETGPPRLRLIRGGRTESEPTAGLRVALAPESHPPFPVDAVVLEEDTFLVLSAGSEPDGPAEHPIRVMTALLEVQPEEPGSVVVREGQPLRLLAIVHDLNEEPSWREEWVARALNSALREAERRGLRSVGLEPLGTVHGRLGRQRFLALLREALEQSRPQKLERLWVMDTDG